MTTPSAVAVPSNLPQDLLFNAEKIDEAVSSSAQLYTDRLGISRKTLAGAMASISAVNPRGAWVTATAYAPRDVVSNSGTWYIALDSHTSGATFAGDSAAHWRVYQGVVSTDLADTTDTAKGSAMSGHKHTGTGATGTTVRQKLLNWIDAEKDFGVPADGTTNATPALQAMFDEAATRGVREILLPAGTMMIKNALNDADYTCALVLSGLRNVRIVGRKGTKFIVGSGGGGSAEFGMFRLEQCEDVEFCGFEMDGSGITITGVGSNRSRGFVLVNYNVNSKATNLTVTNKRIEFHHIYCHDIGGFVGVPPRTSTLAATPYTDVLTVRDCTGANFIGQDHYIGLSYVRHAKIQNNRVVNPTTLTAHVGNLFVDLSAGCENGMVENNYAIGFTGGGKAESHANEGPGSNEDRPSKNCCFRNNTFEQIGDPITMIYAGPSGGGWYGIKLNGINHSAYNNTITARSINISTGGLYQGIQLTSTITTPVESLHTVYGNSITGPVIGINHDVQAADTTHKYVAHIDENKVYDTYAPASPVASNDGTGIIVSKNAKVRGNSIYRTKYCAISVNSPDQTIVRDNLAYNCATINHAVAAARVTFSQEDSGAVGFFEFSNNTILDDRGASAADYGYFLRAGTTYTNKLKFEPGLTDTVKTGVAFDKYFSTLGISYAVAGITNTGLRTIYTTNTPTAIAPWNTMAWRVGDRAVMAVPAVGVPKAWSCTVAGTPGTWVSEGNL